MDPTDAERAQPDSLQKVFMWAGFSDDMSSSDTAAGSLAALLGASEATKPRILGVIPEADMDATLATWKIPVAGSAPRMPTMVECGLARLATRCCRVIAGSGHTIEDLRKQAADALAAAQAAQTAQPSSSQMSSTAQRKIKLSTIISQVDGTEILLEDEKEIMKAFARYLGMKLYMGKATVLPRTQSRQVSRSQPFGTWCGRVWTFRAQTFQTCKAEWIPDWQRRRPYNLRAARPRKYCHVASCLHSFARHPGND